jgi:hypothetical protein
LAFISTCPPTLFVHFFTSVSESTADLSYIENAEFSKSTFASRLSNSGYPFQQRDVVVVG